MAHVPQLVRDEDIDDVLRALADWRRRLILMTLADHSPIPLDRLAIRVAAAADDVSLGAVDDATHAETAAMLHHHHLPELAAMDLLTYDSAGQTVARSPHSIQSTLQPLFDSLDALDPDDGAGS